MLRKVEGIVISEINYRETSKIINIFTKDLGIVGVMAKGARRVKSSLSGLTTKLTYGMFDIYYKEHGLSTLVEVNILDNFKNIKRDINLISYACYLLELSTQVYKHDNNPDIYSLLISSLKKIDAGYDYQVITNILELKLLEYLGIKPVIDSCVSCGKKTDIVTISSYRGGYLCKNCVQDESIVNIKTIKLLRMFYYVDISKISKLDITDTIKKELDNFINDYYDRYSGIYLNSKKILKDLENI